MLESFNNNFEYKKLSEQEQKERGILGRLVGPIADTLNPTRNGRAYPRKLWEKVFDDPIVQEKIDNRCFFGELDHPSDRDETCSEKVAVCLAEKPKAGKDGMLYGVFDILPTPNGKILKAFCDYGTTVGISSRGTGDIIYNDNGEEVVDESTYDCQGFDVVLVPAMKSARLTYVTESLDIKNKKDFKQALTESLNKANPDDKRIMEETLTNLGISLTEDINTSNSDNNIDIKEDSDKKEDVSDTEATILVKSLQEALSSKLSLEKQIQELQEKLAVSDTKTKKLEEELNKSKNVIVRLSNLAQTSKELKEENQSLKSKLDEKSKLCINQSDRISKLAEKLSTSTDTSKCLNESVEKKDKEINSLKEKYNTEIAKYEDQVNKLNEQLLDTKTSSNTKVQELEGKLTKSIKLTEKYKGFVKTTVDRYIKSKAVMLGISENEIKNRLSESYTLDEIDSICESLQVYNLRMSKLPFNLSKDTKVKITESKEKQYAPEKISPEDDVAGLVNFLKD